MKGLDISSILTDKNQAIFECRNDLFINNLHNIKSHLEAIRDKTLDPESEAAWTRAYIKSLEQIIANLGGK